MKKSEPAGAFVPLKATSLVLHTPSYLVCCTICIASPLFRATVTAANKSSTPLPRHTRRFPPSFGTGTPGLPWLWFPPRFAKNRPSLKTLFCYGSYHTGATLDPESFDLFGTFWLPLAIRLSRPVQWCPSGAKRDLQKRIWDPHGHPWAPKCHPRQPQKTPLERVFGQK